ncbi:MAG: zf-HC2 domain-containing protein [Bacteroidota bacterium]
MICEEVKINLHDYIDEQLDDLTKREVEQHIRNCDLCFKEYKKMIVFFDQLRQLPAIIDPPKNILDSVKTELMSIHGLITHADQQISSKAARKIRKEKEKQEKKIRKDGAAVRKSRVTKGIYKKPYNTSTPAEIKKLLLTVLPLAVIAFAYFLYDFQKYNYPWQVINVTGKPIIGTRTDENDKWKQGELLSTDDKSKAVVHIPKVGTMEIGINTQLLLNKAKDGANKVTLNQGKINVINNEEMPDFSIFVNGFEVINRGGKFEIENIPMLGAKLKAGYAFVEIVHNGSSYLLDENHICKLKKGFRPGTPVNIFSSDSLRASVESFDFEDGGEAAVEKIISLAKEQDMLTLLALIPVVPQLQRQIIFQEISNRFPPPESVTRAGIIRLDTEMLYRWWQEIEWQL